VRIGTRGSALALAQARHVAALVQSVPGLEPELVPITTSGDKLPARGGPTDKSRFVKEIEEALLAGQIELAVHSAKDVPADIPDGLEIAAVPPGEDPRDALVGAVSLDALAPGARVGTSSLRRASQLRAVREDLEVVPLRGNVDTRLRKLADGECDAALLALAGLRRLGRESEAGAALDPTIFIPAPGQGLLALQARAGSEVARLVAQLSDPASRARLDAERAVVETLEAGCNTPVGAYARVTGTDLEVCGYAGLPDGSEWITDRLSAMGGAAAAAGAELARRMLSAGAADLLRRAAEVESSTLDR
jgi:hydroxymethylbilane synthase